MLAVRIHTLTILFSLLLVSSGNLSAQHIISGKLSGSDGKPIPFANITWKKDTTRFATFFTVADEAGYFMLDVKQEQLGFLSITAVGFTPLLQHVRFTSVDTLHLTFVLHENGELEEVVIRNPPAIRISGDTTSFLISKLQRGDETSLRELIKNLPGFTVTGTGKLVYNGRIIDRVLLEDDDISGKNYETLVANLPVNHIREIQVIQHQSDKLNILSRWFTGNEQVLNIKYDDRAKTKPITTLEAGGGYPTEVNEAGIQFLSLDKRIKGPVILNTNSSGDVSFFTQSASGIFETQEDAIYELSLEDLELAAQASAITTTNPQIKPAYRNRSTLGLAQLQVKFNPKMLAKITAAFDDDRFRQNNNSLIRYFPNNGASSFFTQNRFQQVGHRYLSQVFLNYLPNDKNQWGLVTKLYQAPTNRSFQTIRENGQAEQYLDQTVSGIGARLSHIHLYSAKTAITISATATHRNARGKFDISPPSFNVIFQAPNVYDRIEQNEKTSADEFSWNSALIVRSGKRVSTAEMTIDWNNQVFSNPTRFQSANGSLQKIADSTSNVHLQQLHTTLQLRNVYTFNANTMLSISAGGLLIRSGLTAGYGAAPQQLNQLKPVVNVEFSRKYDNNTGGIFSFSQAINGPGITSLGTGYTINNITQISSGVAQYNQWYVTTARLTFFNTDLVHRKRSLVSGIIFHHTPFSIVSSITAYPGFTYNQKLPAARSVSFLYWNTGYQKLSRQYKTLFSMNLGLSNGRQLINTGTGLLRTRFFQVKPAIGFRSDIGAWRIETNTTYTISHQQSTVSSWNYNLQEKLTVNLKLNDRLFIESGMDYYYNRLNGQPSAQLTNLYAGLRYKLKNLELSVNGYNLLDQQHYAETTQGTDNLTIDTFQTFPRFILASWKIHF